LGRSKFAPKRLGLAAQGEEEAGGVEVEVSHGISDL
jgi:hypothetical protein